MDSYQKALPGHDYWKRPGQLVEQHLTAVAARLTSREIISLLIHDAGVPTMKIEEPPSLSFLTPSGCDFQR